MSRQFTDMAGQSDAAPATVIGEVRSTTAKLLLMQQAWWEGDEPGIHKGTHHKPGDRPGILYINIAVGDMV